MTPSSATDLARAWEIIGEHMSPEKVVDDPEALANDIALAFDAIAHGTSVAAQPAEGELEQRAFHAANDPTLPQHARTLVADLWRAHCIASPTPPTAPAVPAGVREALTELVSELGRWDRWVIGGTQAEKHGADLVKAKMIERLNAIVSPLPAQPNSSEGEPTDAR